MKDLPEPKHYFSELYASLCQDELRNVAVAMRVDIGDVRQEAQLLCWTIASGQSKFDDEKGSPRQYIMGSLWRDADREIWAGGIRMDAEDYEEISEDLPCPIGDPLQQMLEDESDKWHGLSEPIFHPQSYEALLFLGGSGFREIEKLTGTSKSSIQRRIAQQFNFGTVGTLKEVAPATLTPSAESPAIFSTAERQNPL